MTKFVINNTTDALKTDINFFFTITNSRIAGSCSLTHEFLIHVSVRILTLEISHWACVNFCSYREKIRLQHNSLPFLPLALRFTTL